MEIVYVYARERKDFGRPVKIQDTASVSLYDISVSTDQFEEHVKHRNTSRGTQSIPELSDHEANTERFETNSVGVNHLEGGWPKDVDPLEAEHTIRYRKKIEKDEAYLASVRNLCECV